MKLKFEIHSIVQKYTSRRARWYIKVDSGELMRITKYSILLKKLT